MFSPKGIELLNTKHEVDFRELTQNEFEQIAFNYEGLFIRFNHNINSKILNEYSKVKYILCPTTGLDHINLDLVKKFKIELYSIKGEPFLKDITATAELAILFILLSQRNVISSFVHTKNNLWDPSLFKGNELKSKVLGIIGLGRLGKIIADVINKFGVKVIFYDINDAIKSSTHESVSLNYLLSTSDIISVNASLDCNTNYILDENEFSLMKKGVSIINTSRGALINSEILIKYLDNQKVKNAFLDVIENENAPNNKLIKYSKECKNLFISPHIGGTTFESIEKTDIFLINKFLNNCT